MKSHWIIFICIVVVVVVILILFMILLVYKNHLNNVHLRKKENQETESETNFRQLKIKDPAEITTILKTTHINGKVSN